MNKTRLATAKRLVVKVGSALVTNNGAGLDLAAIDDWARQIAALRAQGKEVVLVSSGAIACGMQRLGWSRRPKSVHELQAAAAVGQMGLVQVYEGAFAKHGLHTAQILLTHEDLADRKRYLNARSTLTTLLGLGVVPIINENDTVVTDEIKFGDNDTLGALVANLIEADALIILTDQTGLFTADPRKDPSATLIREATAGDEALEGMAGGAGTSIGKGGMITKVIAAKRAAKSGAHTVIASGRESDADHPPGQWRSGRHPAGFANPAAGGAQAMARRSPATGRPPDARCRCGQRAESGQKPVADRRRRRRRRFRARRGGGLHRARRRGSRARAEQLWQRRGPPDRPQVNSGNRKPARLCR